MSTFYSFRKVLFLSIFKINFSSMGMLKVDTSVFACQNLMFKNNNRNTRARCEICSNLTIKTSKRRYWLRSDVFIVNFEHIPHFVLLFLLLTLSR